MSEAFFNEPVHMRVRHDDDVVLNSVVLWCREHSKVTLAVKEFGKNDGKHIHILLDPIKTVSTFRQKFVAKFPILKGNQSYSMKKMEKNLDHNIRYCCKGKKKELPQVLFTILTENEIEDAHKRFWQEQEKYLTEHGAKPIEFEPVETVQAKTRKTMPFKEKVVAQLPEELCIHYCELYCKNKDAKEYIRYDKVRQRIIDQTMLCMGRLGKDLDDNILIRMINGVLLKIMTDYGNEEQQKKFFGQTSSRIIDRVY